MEILLAIVTTIFGAALSQVISRWDSWRQTANRGDLRGEWFSISHAGDHSLVRDKCQISRRWGKLYIKNEGNSFGYSYDATGSIEHQNILIGKWRSLREGSSLGGRIVLIVSPQASSMLGIYTGKAIDGRDVILGWVLARTEVELELAMARCERVYDFPKAGISPTVHE